MGFQEPGSSTAEVRGQLQIARDLALFMSGDTTKWLFEIVLCFAQYGDTCLQFKLFRGLMWRCKVQRQPGKVSANCLKIRRKGGWGVTQW